MPLLLCNLLVDQEERYVERYWREDVEAERHHELVIGRFVSIPGIDLALSLDDIYEGIDLAPSS